MSRRGLDGVDARGHESPTDCAACGFCDVDGACGADSIILISGARLEGEIVDENEQEVRIRLPFGTGGIKYVESIKRSRIERIERSPLIPSTRRRWLLGRLRVSRQIPVR